MPKYVYRFSEGDKDQKDLLGGKGANLAEMTRLGLPVPPGFTITTDACRAYLADGTVPDELAVQVTTALREMEEELGRQLGAPEDPLLVSVRSGAKFSMPGMMETVLNIGLNDESVLGLAEASSDARFAWDSYRRLIQMFGKTVLDIDGDHFSERLDAKKAERGVTLDYELDVEALKELVAEYKSVVLEYAGIEFPQDPRAQLDMATEAVFRSGTPSGPTSTVAARRSRTTWAPPSTCAPWSSATWARLPARACASPVTPPPAAPASTVTTWSTPRVRTSWPVSATPCPWRT